jgi:hypothetical protein
MLRQYVVYAMTPSFQNLSDSSFIYHPPFYLATDSITTPATKKNTSWSAELLKNSNVVLQLGNTMNRTNIFCFSSFKY